jgi:hypothetical protein
MTEMIFEFDTCQWLRSYVWCSVMRDRIVERWQTILSDPSTLRYHNHITIILEHWHCNKITAKIQTFELSKETREIEQIGHGVIVIEAVKPLRCVFCTKPAGWANFEIKMHKSVGGRLYLFYAYMNS